MSNQFDDWQDTSPHLEGYFEVDGLRLHYLDWGGDGPPLILLPGLGDTAHIFDELAPELTSHYRVLALTRRGHGASDAPSDGYAVQDLARDIAAFLHYMDLEQVTLVGHSIAGNEMTHLASSDPGRLKRLVYLDAAYDRSGTLKRIEADPATRLPRSNPPTTLAQYREHGARYFGFWNSALESDLSARLRRDETGKLGGTPPDVLRSIVEHSDRFAPDYSAIPVQATAVYALFGDQHWSPLANELVESAEIETFMRDVMKPWQRRSIDQFRKQLPRAKVLKLEEAHHHLFFSHRELVVRLLTEYV